MQDSERTSTATGDGGSGQEATDAGLSTSQCLTFGLADEEYGIDILRVQEIRVWSKVTRIPNSPPYVLGVMNLRGTIVPIIDLRLRFRLDRAEYTPQTVIVVVTVQSEHNERTIGVVVDRVSDVLDLKPGDIQPAPDFGTIVTTEYIQGLASVEERTVMLLSVDRLLNPEELSQLDRI